MTRLLKNHIHAHIITCNIEEPEQKYRLGTVSNILLGGGGSVNIDKSVTFIYTDTDPMKKQTDPEFETKLIRKYLREMLM